MKRIDIVSLVAAICMTACAAPAVALPPPAAPFTLWNFLGIPQGLNKIRDATSNRRGNFPGLERKPALKALADPQNLNSPVSAIKKAAEIKTEEDMAPQKIKAIKYLATVGCGCYGGVKEALLESLDDCTEEVRYQTVLAIEDAASMHCEVCNRDCCCDEELTKKLAEMAYERNDKGCWLEPSERVREAAKRAMCACCPGQGPSEPEAQPAQPEETIPAPPEAPSETIPDSDRSAQRLPPTTERIQASRTKVMLPHGTAVGSEATETEEIVTLDFGNQGSQPIVSSRRSTTSAAGSKAAPASTRRTKPPAGPSSRRSAAQRGLAAPSESQRTAALQQPAGATDKLLRRASDDEPERPAADATSVAYVTDQATRKVSLAPKAGPPAVSADEVDRPRSRVRGTVARISRDAGIVEVRLETAGQQLAAGDRLQVSHEYLLDGGVVLGYLEVISSGPRGVTARPIGDLNLDQMSRGDHATLEPARSASSGNPSSAARRLPAVSNATVSR